MDTIIADCLLMFADVRTKQCNLQNPSEINSIFYIHIAFNKRFSVGFVIVLLQIS
jgi:hypothetical protein